MSKKVIITGFSGQTGSLLGHYLLNNTDFEIVGTLRRTSQIIDANIKNLVQSPRVRIESMDLNDSCSIISLIKKEKPDYFINLGAQTFVADSWNSPALHMQTNSTSLIHILEAVKSYAPDCRVYSAGSSEQFGDVHYSPQDEEHPMSPRSVYGAAKCAASHICKVYRESYGMYVVHGLLFNHESEIRQKYFVTRKITSTAALILSKVHKGECFEPLELGNLDAKRDWSHAADFVDGIWRMMNQEQYNEELKGVTDTKELSKLIKSYVLSSNETHPVREFVELTFKQCGLSGKWEGQGLNEKYIGKSGQVLVQINPQFFRPAEVELLWGSSDKIRKELGWSPKYTFQDLVRVMVENDIKKA